MDLPDELSGLRDMAAEIVRDSDGTDLDMVMALIEFFTDNTWQYSEEIPFAGFGDDADGQWSALLEFLEARVGYCVHYATAFAALSLGRSTSRRGSLWAFTRHMFMTASTRSRPMTCTPGPRSTFRASAG